MERRKKYFIKKKFQTKMIVSVILIVVGAIILSGLLSYIMALHMERKSDIQFYGTTSGNINDMIAISSVFIVKPIIIKALLISGIISIIMAIILTILYSHRLAGPIYRMEKHLSEMINGNYDMKLKLRSKDEFKDLADMINMLQGNLKKLKVN